MNPVSRKILKADLIVHRQLQVHSHFRLHGDDLEPSRGNYRYGSGQGPIKVVASLGLVVKPEAEPFGRPVMDANARAGGAPGRDIEPVLTEDANRRKSRVRLRDDYVASPDYE